MKNLGLYIPPPAVRVTRATLSFPSDVFSFAAVYSYVLHGINTRAILTAFFA